MYGTSKGSYTIYEGEALKELQARTGRTHEVPPLNHHPSLLGTAVLKAPRIIAKLTSPVVGGLGSLLR